MKEIQDLLKREAEAILNIPADEAFYKAKDLIYKRVHEMKGKLVCSGMGKAGQIALNMATTFSSTGTPAVFLHPSDAQHGDLGIVRENDLLLLISNSGKTREIIELVSLSEKLNGKLPLIVIGSNSRSDLARMADVFISTGDPKEVCPLNLTPTTSTTAMTVIGDILVVLQMKKLGFTTLDYAKRHHGGYLGHKSRNNSENENTTG